MPGNYAYYKSIGICPDCRKREPESGKVFCKTCAAQRKAYQKAHREMANKAYRNLTTRRKENGLCRKCGEPLDKEGIYCKECNWLRMVKRRIIAMRKRKGTWTGKFWDETAKEKICLAILEKWGCL